MNGRLNKIVKLNFTIILLAASTSSAYSVTSQFGDYLDEFPYACSTANDREPMSPGHILQLGFITPTSYGWSFMFPGKGRSNLLRIGMLDNAGIIGEEQFDNLNSLIRFRTPGSSFVVAQVFVGDEENPVVTCVSRPIALTSYTPSYYGNDFSWLDRASFGRWLGYRKFRNWNHRYHRDNRFKDIRVNFRKYFKDDRRWRIKQKYFDRTRDRNRDRFKDVDRDNNQRDRNRIIIRESVVDGRRKINIQIRDTEKPTITNPVLRPTIIKKRDISSAARNLRVRKKINLTIDNHKLNKRD